MYALYLWTYLSSVLAHLAFFGLPGSALWGGLAMGTVAVPLTIRLVARQPVAAA
jgi:putative membrane protein